MTGIIGAMKIETAGIIKAMENVKTEIVSGIVFSVGKLESKDVVVATCGVGKVFAAVCAEIMILRFHVDFIINTGVAGTLTDELGIGDVAVADRLVQYDMDTSAVGDPVGLISGINTVYISASDRGARLISRILGEMGVVHLIGTIASGDRFVNDRETKERIVSLFGGIACEMESAAIAQVCYINNTEFSVIRTISDNANGETPTEYSRFLEESAEKGIAIIKKIIKKF